MIRTLVLPIDCTASVDLLIERRTNHMLPCPDTIRHAHHLCNAGVVYGYLVCRLAVRLQMEKTGVGYVVCSLWVCGKEYVVCGKRYSNWNFTKEAAIDDNIVAVQVVYAT